MPHFEWSNVLETRKLADVKTNTCKSVPSSLELLSGSQKRCSNLLPLRQLQFCGPMNVIKCVILLM